MLRLRKCFKRIYICLHLHLERKKKDQGLPGHDYMLYFAVTFLIREHTGVEDVEQVESQSVWFQEHFIATYSFADNPLQHYTSALR